MVREIVKPAHLCLQHGWGKLFISERFEYLPLDRDDRVEFGALRGVERQLGKLRGRFFELRPADLISREQAAIIQYNDLARAALHTRQQLGETAAALRGPNRLVDGGFAAVRQLIDGDRAREQRDDQRQRHQREPHQQQF